MEDLQKKVTPEVEELLSEESQILLLRIARSSIESHLSGKSMPQYEITDPKLRERRGAFVTLHKDGRLRGCIGYVFPIKPLYQTVQEVAVAAAVDDPRFPPVKLEEMEEIEIEISALTPLRRIRSIDEIKVGTHGIYIKRGINSGLLLPQVAVEYEWDREQFLANTCQKAWLPPDAWKDPMTEIYIFSAQVFSEKEKGLK